MRPAARLAILLCLLLLRAPAAQAQAPAELAQAFDRLQAPGALMYLERPGRSPETYALGLSDTVTGRQVRPGDPFAAGSITKMLVAVVVLKLAEEGRLKLDDPLAKYLPEFPQAGRLTLRELLGQRSGLADFTTPLASGGGNALSLALLSVALARPWTHAELERLVASQPLRFEPGTACEYSNSNYIILGRVIEQVTSRRVSEEMHRLILDPLGMKDTLLAAEEALPQADIRSYALVAGRPVDTLALENASFAWTAGALVSTAPDLARFARALFEGGLLKPESLEEMEQAGEMPGIGRYGLGLMERGTGAGLHLGHSGRTAGFSAELWYFPASRTVAVAAANLRDCDSFSLVRAALAAAGSAI